MSRSWFTAVFNDQVKLTKTEYTPTLDNKGNRAMSRPSQELRAQGQLKRTNRSSHRPPSRTDSRDSDPRSGRGSHSSVSGYRSGTIVDPPSDDNQHSQNCTRDPVSRGERSEPLEASEAAETAEPSGRLTALQAIEAHRHGTLTQADLEGMDPSQSVYYQAWLQEPPQQPTGTNATAGKKEKKKKKGPTEEATTT